MMPLHLLNLKQPGELRPSSSLAYVVVLLSVLLAFLLRAALEGILHSNAPLLIFIMPVVVSAYVGGIYPGLLATLSGAVIGSYFFIAYRYSFALPELSEGVRISIFVLEGVFISAICEALLRARGRAEANLAQLRLSEAALREAHRDLEERVEERTLALSSAKGLLEQRTDELEAVNRELESFSYSVAHDLRAPLRHVSGYSAALLETNSTLDETSQGYLRRIEASARRMNELIDSLLNLSRLGRAAIKRRPLELSRLVRELAEHLHHREPERQIRFSIQPDLRVTADEGLLEAALRNLLENALKYSRNSPQTEIRFGCRSEGGECVFFLQDNGAGFDMQQAERLFVPFQRLHSDSEFEGTGVGLATVQRIIHRHGGRIWAEASVGEGATFLFTLPEPSGGDGSRGRMIA